VAPGVIEGVPQGGGLSVEAIVDTRGLSSRTYEGDLVIECLDCSKLCMQDKTLIHLEVAVGENEYRDPVLSPLEECLAGGDQESAVDREGRDPVIPDPQPTPDSRLDEEGSDCSELRLLYKDRREDLRGPATVQVSRTPLYEEPTASGRPAFGCVWWKGTVRIIGPPRGNGYYPIDVEAIRDENAEESYTLKKSPRVGWIPASAITPPRKFELREAGSGTEASMGVNCGAAKG
jgi:hypothetical protein